MPDSQGLSELYKFRLLNDHEQVILKRWARRSDECVP